MNWRSSYRTILANILLVMFILPLATIAFFLPLWAVHLDMVATKEAYADKFAGRVTKL